LFSYHASCSGEEEKETERERESSDVLLTARIQMFRGRILCFLQKKKHKQDVRRTAQSQMTKKNCKRETDGDEEKRHEDGW